MTPILYFSDKCPDTAAFVAQLQALNVSYEAASISESMANLKRFLALRDNDPQFNSRKQQGYIGIPALVLASGEVLFEPADIERVFGVQAGQN